MTVEKKQHSGTISARQTAVRLLTQAEKNQSYVNLLLRKQLQAFADSRDKQLVTVLVNGVMKHRGTLDYIVRRHLRKPLAALPLEVRYALRIGVFQILYLERIPVSAAVNESVQIAKKVSPALAGVVNSVLRRTAEQGWEIAWPDSKKDLSRYLAIRYSHPEWLVRRWLTLWGRDETEKLCLLNNEPAVTWARTNTLRCQREELARRLAERGLQVRLSSKIPEALALVGFSSLDDLPEFQEGLFTIQDESSQLAAHLLRPLPGQRVLDVCSAPGGKTAHMAQLMENRGSIIALDQYAPKLELIRQTAQRLGITVIETVLGDARNMEGLSGFYDKVLVDAPCSGLGVLRRRADLRWQKEDESIALLPALQLAILLEAATKVAPGGELLYATCTLEPRENFEVAKAFLAQRPDFRPVDMRPLLPLEITDERDLKQLKKGLWQILPQRHQMDGFFMAKFSAPGL